MRLANGLAWALPVCLAVESAPSGDRIALADESGRVLAVLDVEEVFDYDKEREAVQCFRTTDDAHPGVARLYAQHDRYVAGPVTVFERWSPRSPSCTGIPPIPGESSRSAAGDAWSAFRPATRSTGLTST